MSTHQRCPGQYELRQCINRDTFKEVWNAFDTYLQRNVSLTILHFKSPTTTDHISRFLEKVTCLQSFLHPNIVPLLGIYDSVIAGSNDREVYVVYDIIAESSLADYIRETSYVGKFPSGTELLHYLAPIASAIDYAHLQGIIHGMVSPQAIVLKQGCEDCSDVPLLAGFGMYIVQAPITLPLQAIMYISPEQAQGYGENIRSDVYALGTILYELCTGIPPFQGETTADIIVQLIHAQPIPPVLINPQITPALASVIMRGLAKEPVARFPSAVAMVNALAKAFNLPPPDPIEIQPLTDLSPLTQQVSFAHGQVDEDTAVQTAPNENSPLPILPAKEQAKAQPTLEPFAKQPSPNFFLQPPINCPRQRKNASIVLTAFLLFALLGSGLATFLMSRYQTFSGTQDAVGHAFFVSSGLISRNSDQGSVDRLQIALKNINDPPPGKTYYAWFLGDANSERDVLPMPLGRILPVNGSATLSYPGDPLHSNLLTSYSRLLITQERANSVPSGPSPSQSDWLYAASLAQMKNPEDTVHHYSLLDHLRHLLVQDPKLKNVGLVGGLDTWLFRNSLKILEWSGSARDAYQAGDIGLMHRQLERILYYLDGSQMVAIENIPADLPRMPVDEHIARVALLQISQSQDPPGYLKHIGFHLREIIKSPGVTPEQKQLAFDINKGITATYVRLVEVHNDASKLIHYDSDQLTLPATLALLNHMATQANYTFAGQADHNTNQMKDGVAQIHYKVQSLATFTIHRCVMINTKSSCAMPGTTGR